MKCFHIVHVYGSLKLVLLSVLYSGNAEVHCGLSIFGVVILWDKLSFVLHRCCNDKNLVFPYSFSVLNYFTHVINFSPISF